MNLSGIVERYIVFETSGWIKERTQTSTEMGAGCQRNGLEMGVGRGEEVCRKGSPYIRQLANEKITEKVLSSVKIIHLKETCMKVQLCNSYSESL